MKLEQETKHLWLLEQMEKLLDNLKFQFYYWKRVGVAFNSWCFRMSILTEDDLKNKVPENKLGIYSDYCGKSNWEHHNGPKNFWFSINEGYIEMLNDYFGKI